MDGWLACWNNCIYFFLNFAAFFETDLIFANRGMKSPCLDIGEFCARFMSGIEVEEAMSPKELRLFTLIGVASIVFRVGLDLL